MPQPISVALVVAKESEIGRLKRKFRLGMPGIGRAHYCALDSVACNPARMPQNSIHLWLAMDESSFEACQRLPAHTDRGFYADRFPQPVVRVASVSELEGWVKRIEDAYVSTS